MDTPYFMCFFVSCDIIVLIQIELCDTRRTGNVRFYCYK